MKALPVRRPWIPSFARRNQGHILIACFPKSGSTYLSLVLQELTGFPDWYGAEPGEQNEQDLSARRLRRPRRRSVLQQHMKATHSNLELLVAYHMRPIVQTRNLYDIVASLHDYFQGNRSSLSCGYISDEYLQMPWRERLDYLIHIHLPWYFNFVLSWREAARRIDVCHVTYETLFANQERELKRILAFYDMQASDEEIEAAMARAAAGDTRFNVGVVGRGIQLLTDEHKQAIRRLAGSCRVVVDEGGTISSLIEDSAKTPRGSGKRAVGDDRQPSG